MAIKISGYETVFYNEVYSRDTKIGVNGEDIPAKEVIILKRYSEPRKEDVIEYLKQKVESLTGAASIILLTKSAKQERSKLEQLILSLSEQVRSHIRTGDEEFIGFIKENISLPDLEKDEEPTQFVNVRYGLIPTEAIEKSEEHIENYRWYDAALSTYQIGEWVAGILLEKGNFPSMDEIDILLKHRTYGIDFLDEKRRIIETVKSSLASPEDISQLVDLSEGVLEEFAIVSISKIHNQLAINRALQQRNSQQ